MKEYRYCDNITRKQLEYTYKNDVKEIEQEISRLNTIIKCNNVYDLPEEHIKKYEQMIKDYKVQLNNMKVEKDLTEITLED